MKAIDGPSGQSANIFLLHLCGSRFLLHLGLQNYPALILVLQQEWQMSGAAAGSVISAYQMGLFLSFLILSVLTDWVSTKKVFIVSSVASAVFCLLFGFLARGHISALILRGLMGLTLGGTYTPGLKMISEVLPPSIRGRAMGFFIGASALGAAGSVALTGWIAAGWGWRWAFIISSVVSAVGGGMVFFTLRSIETPRPERKRRSFRFPRASNRPAIWLIAGYSAHEWELEGMRAWMPAFLVASLLAAGTGKVHSLQIGSTLSALVLLIGVLSTGIAGILSDRIGRTTVILIMTAFSSACSFAIGWMIGGPMIWVGAIALAYGFFAIAPSPVYSTALTEVVALDRLGTALGIRSLIACAIAGLVPTVFGAVLDWTNRGAAELHQGFIPVWGWAFSILGGGGLFGIWTMLRLRSLPESTKMGGGKK